MMYWNASPLIVEATLKGSNYINIPKEWCAREMRDKCKILKKKKKKKIKLPESRTNNESTFGHLFLPTVFSDSLK